MIKASKTLLKNDCSLAEIPTLSWKIQCNWVSHWRYYQVLSFLSTTLMQETGDITGGVSRQNLSANEAFHHECDFTWLYTLQTGYIIFVQWTTTMQIYNMIFPNNFLLDDAKNSSSQRGFTNFTYTTASLPRQMLITKQYQQRTAKWAMIDLNNAKLWAVGRSIYLTC